MMTIRFLTKRMKRAGENLRYSITGAVSDFMKKRLVRCEGHIDRYTAIHLNLAIEFLASGTTWHFDLIST